MDMLTDETIQQTLADTTWRTAFSSYLEAEGVSVRTIRAYQQDITVFGRWYEGVNGEPFTPSGLTSMDLRAYRAQAVAIKTAPATFNRRRATLIRLAQWAMASELLGYNPLRGFERIEEAQQSPRWLTPADAHRLVRALEQEIGGAQTPTWNYQAIRDRALVGLMLYAGLRVSEVCNLNLDDVSIMPRGGRVTVWGKGEKRRFVPLGAELRQVLREYLAMRGDAPGALFTGKRLGMRMQARGVEHRLDHIRRAAGLGAEVTPHALRHTFAKQLVDRGQQLPLVRKLLGHSRLDTTARYTMPGWEDMENAVE